MPPSKETRKNSSGRGAQQSQPDFPLLHGPEFPLPFVVNPTGTSANQNTIILLHGRNGSGAEFAAELFESQDSEGKTLPELLLDYRWVFPSARAIFSKTFQEDLNQWYDVDSLTNPSTEAGMQIDELKEAITYVRELVKQEQTMIGTGKVILGGISQGFSVAVVAELVEKTGVDALVGFATWLPFHSIIAAITKTYVDISRDLIRDIVSRRLLKVLDPDSISQPTNPEVPMFLAHCADDDVVDIEHGRKLKRELEAMGHRVTWVETAQGGHWINEPDCISELVTFLRILDQSTLLDNRA